MVNEREREGAMSELIQAVVTIKDPFTLFAFLAVILLIVFRTKTVPESMFKLVSAKITRDRFYALLNRAMLSAVGIFLVLCGIAVLGQLLNYKTAVRAASVEDVKEELALRHADDTAARHALEEYQKGLALAQDQKLSEAISSLESSLKAVPTAAARETLALLYQRVGNRTGAIVLAEQAVQTARETGSAVKTVRAERLLRAVQAPAPAVVSKRCPSGAGLIGPKLDLPPGGDTFETAPLLAPCVYKGMLDSESSQYYKFSLQAGQTLKIVMRSRDMRGYAAFLSLKLHGPNGGVIGGYSTSSESTVTKPLEYKADESGAVYVSVHGAVRESAFEFAIQ
jgi:tetratricopeptide (TPR) repeat protein